MKKILAIAVASIFTSVAYADDKKLYLGIEYGYSKLDNQTGQVADALVDTFGGSVNVTQDKTIGLGRLFFGYKINEILGVEGGYFQTSKANLNAAGVSGGSVSYTLNANTKVTGYDLSALIRPTKASGMNGLFGRVGIHNSKYKNAGSITVSGTTYNLGTEDASGTGMLYGFGYDAPLGDGFLRLQATRLTKIGGDSDEDATVYSIGIGMSF